MMSQGTSGDSNTANYAKPKPTWTIDEYADGLVDKALDAYRRIQYTPGLPLAMAESTLPLSRRVADAKRLAWAEETARNQKGEKPANQPEVYAHEQLYVRDSPKRELKLQAIRMGEIGFTAIPNEVYAITGLKLKAQSPLKRTINIELANGAEGYIPPPEQHPFGGYTTWAARSAGLETTAEPKIVENLLLLLESVSDRRRLTPPVPAHAAETLALKPAAYWPLEDFAYGSALDLAGKNPLMHTGRLALYLDGAAKRSVYLAGGSLEAKVAVPGQKYTVEFWFWPGIEQDGELLAINGKPAITSRNAAIKTWHHAALVSDGKKTRIFLDGQLNATEDAIAIESLRIGGGFEGKIDEAAVYPRAVPVKTLYRPNRFSK